jgi:DNA modification methylase
MVDVSVNMLLCDGASSGEKPVPAEQFLSGGMALHCGDCLEVLTTLPENSIDSCVTDPPYGLKFMGKHWDHGVPGVDYWRKIYRVLKPGAHLVVFGGTRTYHRMVCAIEDAGFEIRDCISWLYGNGFPKSHDVSKGIDRARRRDFVQAAIDLEIPLPKRSVDDWTKEEHAPGDKWWSEFKASLPADMWAAIERETIGQKQAGMGAGKTFGMLQSEGDNLSAVRCIDITSPATDAARQWDGWGTALKPAVENIVLARKPLSEKTVAANVLRWGTGAINVDGSRIALDGDYKCKPNGRPSQTGLGDNYDPRKANIADTVGRWPANVVHDGSAEVLAGFPETTSGLLAKHHSRGNKTETVYGKFANNEQDQDFGGDSGSAARFFYQAKADADDRLGSKHPTIKPVDLMQWLIRLVTPPRGTILDPFAGTGTTGEAAFREGMRAVMIEREEEYQADIRRRMALIMAGPDERKRESIKAKHLPRDDGPLFGFEAR